MTSNDPSLVQMTSYSSCQHYSETLFMFKNSWNTLTFWATIENQHTALDILYLFPNVLLFFWSWLHSSSNSQAFWTIGNEIYSAGCIQDALKHAALHPPVTLLWPKTENLRGRGPSGVLICVDVFVLFLFCFVRKGTKTNPCVSSSLASSAPGSFPPNHTAEFLQTFISFQLLSRLKQTKPNIWKL